MTKQSPTVISLALLALALGGCQGVVWANLAAMAVTVGLFLGTVQLRRVSSVGSAVTSSAMTSVHETLKDA
ncbi:MAG: hypothetical protein Q8Q09_12185 [Deltaproteobacteria bacterium]|nr:hypothetical protein [Deltaproteobacteria bacterium]